jgi:hypothetical protein
MFYSANGHDIQGDHLDLSFNRTDSWAGTGWGMSSLSLAVGDAERGPMVGLFSIPTQPGDEEKFPPIIHMHRSDSFRTIFNGDFYVGRTIYADGEARLQAAGAYYGPEQPGPDVIRQSGTVWSLLVFGDKRGYKVQPADKKYMEMHNHAEAELRPLFDKLGIGQTLPEDSSGESHIETNLDLALKAGHADLGFDGASAWPAVGASQVAAVALSNQDCGPLVLALVTPAGETALPAATWDTEVILAVIEGDCRVGGDAYASGDVRVQKAGAGQEAIVAGPQGLKAYVLFGDRRGAQGLAASGADTALAEAFNAVTGRFAQARTPLPA